MLKNYFMPLLKLIIACFVCGLRAAQSLENIAYKKPAEQSSTYRSAFEANKAVDGDKSTFALGNEEPRTLNWWKVDLISEYYILQVILTPRQDFDDGRMNNVFIGISNSPGISGDIKYPVYPLCRQSPYISSTYQNISISCRPNTPPGRFVVVQQPDVSPGYLTISEIQVYGIKLEKTYLGSNTCQGNYYGDNCDKYCNCDKGVKCDQQGICPNGCDVNWEGKHCDKRKFNINQLIGCYMFNLTLDHDFIRFNSTNCIVTCSGYGFTFGANMTTDSCLCTNVVNRISLVQNENCHKKWNSANCDKWVYSVCPNGTYGYDCTLKCNCLNNGRCSYMEGRCEDGCADGWTGDSCDIRDCARGNGGCDINELCVLYSNGFSHCQCKEKYYRTSIWSPCQTSSDSLNNAAIIGGVIGSIAMLCVNVAMTMLFIMCRKKIMGPKLTSFQNEKANNTSTDPELYELPAITCMENENKYECLKTS